MKKLIKPTFKHLLRLKRKLQASNAKRSFHCNSVMSKLSKRRSASGCGCD